MQPITTIIIFGLSSFIFFNFPKKPVVVSSAVCLTTQVLITTRSEFSSSDFSSPSDFSPLESLSESETFIWQPTVDIKKSFIFMAESMGFEPMVGITSDIGLANRRTRPLCELSYSFFLGSNCTT